MANRYARIVPEVHVESSAVVEQNYKCGRKHWWIIKGKKKIAQRKPPDVFVNPEPVYRENGWYWKHTIGKTS